MRHDYVAGVIGWWAHGAHHWEDYTRADGVLIARRRRVLWRVGTATLPLTVLDVRLGDPVTTSGPSPRGAAPRA